MVVGDLRQDLWQIASSATGVGLQNTYTANIWPYWGEHPNGYPIISHGYNDEHYFGIDISDLWDDLLGESYPSADLGNTYYVTGGELSAILDQGGHSTWEDYIYEKKPGFASGLDIAPDGEVYNVVGAKGAILQVKADNVKSTSRYSATKAASKSLDADATLSDRLYNRLEGFANEYFGKKFLMVPPIVCTYPSEQVPYSYDMNWVPSDGAWTEGTVLDLGTGAGSGNAFRSSDALEMFRQPDGRIGCICKFENTTKRIDMTNWDYSEYYQPWSSGAYTMATAEKIVFLDPINRLYPRVVVSISKPVSSNKVFLDNEEYGFTDRTATLASMFPDAGDMATRNAFANNMATMFGSDTVGWGAYPTPLLPSAAAIPLKSMTLRYGPWKGDSFADDTIVTDFVIEQDLNPWTYGGVAWMNTVGQMMADNKVLNKKVVELGSITVAGSPQYSLGDILAGDGPELTSIDVSVGSNGITTTYQLRTFTPDYNTFSQTKIDNMRKRAEDARYIQRLDNLARLNQARTSSSKNALGTVLNREDRYTRASSHSTDRVINTVVNTDLRKALPEFGIGSGNKWLYRAGMETQGLFRPYTTTSGDSCLMAEFPQSVSLGYSEAVGSTGVYNYANNNIYEFRGPVLNEALPPVMCGTLTPFMQRSTNPSGSQNIDLEDPSIGNLTFTMGSGYGHDIEYVVRDGTYPLDLSIKYPEENYSEENWYRAIGIKGPPVIVGWGFDTAGKPVPNYSEVDGSGGTSPLFADDWLQRPDLWKAGPLDIRWDYERGVWTSPPSYRLVQAKLLGSGSLSCECVGCDCGSETSPSPFLAEIQNDNLIAYDESGDALESKVVSVNNPLGYPTSSGMLCWVQFNPDTSREVSNHTKYELVSLVQHTIAIELAGTLVKFSNALVDAYIRTWDPCVSAFVTDCSEIIQVADKRGVGYEGVAGALGAVELFVGSSGCVGVLVDLCCPGDETGTCVGV
jgi:hypothetical protein